jgi:tRNA A37 N6-isopentenylltransferase MiaA|tara:strand:- start:314 stop:487 length:174 start_codon:yes stop_codon:yes gene_type:complete
MAKRIKPADATRFQRLLALTMSGGEKARKNKRVRGVADTIAAIAFVILILFIWIALP